MSLFATKEYISVISILVCFSYCKDYEVCPPIRWNKADAVLYLLEHLRLGDLAKVFPICIGYDRTNADTFEVCFWTTCTTK